MLVWIFTVGIDLWNDLYRWSWIAYHSDIVAALVAKDSFLTMESMGNRYSSLNVADRMERVSNSTDYFWVYRPSDFSRFTYRYPQLVPGPVSNVDRQLGAHLFV